MTPLPPYPRRSPAFQTTPKVVNRFASEAPLSPSPSQAMIDGQKHARPAPIPALNNNSSGTRVVNEQINVMMDATRHPKLASFRRPTRSETRPVTSASAPYTPIQTAFSQPRSAALTPNSAARRVIANVTPATLMSISSETR
jgi:hypothetical protein